MSHDEALPRREDFGVLRRITTRWADEDVYGHVNNVTYYSYFDTAVNGYLIETSGVDTRTLDAVGVVAETSCRFLRQLRFPADVEVGLVVERLGTSSITYRIGLFQGEAPEPAALGRFVHVYVSGQGDERATTPVPDPVRRAVEPLVR
ncbi:acyl-CoA thioesterase [Solicola sp. PLA-1-18]|uniref:acyl-CoA thioesterase n=1 Tax=Solicola sp. PLA-1-18 TaxID=3380532 RepID=UPI003B78F8B3